MKSRVSTIFLVVCLLAVAVPVFASELTYCSETYDGPYQDFSLTIPSYDTLEHPIINANVNLTVSYEGVFEGTNTDADLACEYNYTMNLAMDSSHLTGTENNTTSLEQLSGEVLVGESVSIPVSGVLWDEFPIEWTDLNDFLNPQVLSFSVPGTAYGFVSQMFGSADFTWNYNLTAQVCVTYTSSAVAAEAVSFDALKASYR